MARRSPARLLAPLALVGFALALLLVLNGGGSDSGRPAGGDGESSAPASATATPKSTPKPASKKPRSYTVKPGDTPSAIADRTGVSLQELERLNPDLDPQLLSPGDRLKLRP